MSDCPHGDGAHWLGDCGDLLDYIAVPATITHIVGQTVIDMLTDTLGLPTIDLPATRGPFVTSIR